MEVPVSKREGVMAFESLFLGSTLQKCTTPLISAVMRFLGCHGHHDTAYGT
jgi:hypothetical protein